MHKIYSELRNIRTNISLSYGDGPGWSGDGNNSFEFEYGDLSKYFEIDTDTVFTFVDYCDA